VDATPPSRSPNGGSRLSTHIVHWSNLVSRLDQTEVPIEPAVEDEGTTVGICCEDKRSAGFVQK
jgi:hypothetical protein